MTTEPLLIRPSEPSKLDSGVFTWDIATDRFFADSAFALLFGLDPAHTMSGLPMEQYLRRVHPEDKARVAKAVHEAVVSGFPCQQNYRVRSGQGTYTEIMAFGRCFRNADGTPSQYAGIVFPMVPVVDESVALQDLCAQAHQAALKSGRLDVARALRAVIEDLNEEPTPSLREHRSH